MDAVLEMLNSLIVTENGMAVSCSVCGGKAVGGYIWHVSNCKLKRAFIEVDVTEKTVDELREELCSKDTN